MVEVTIGRFDCKLISDSDEASYFIFDKKDYELMTNLLETESTMESFGRTFSKIHIPGLNTPQYDKNKNIFELYNEGKDCKLYHIDDCTVQIFTNFPGNNNLAGIFIVNLDKEKRKNALETLEKILE